MNAARLLQARERNTTTISVAGGATECGGTMCVTRKHAVLARRARPRPAPRAAWTPQPPRREPRALRNAPQPPGGNRGESFADASEGLASQELEKTYAADVSISTSRELKDSEPSAVKISRSLDDTSSMYFPCA